MGIRVTIRRNKIERGDSPRKMTRERSVAMLKAKINGKGIFDTRDKLIAAGLIVPKTVS